MSKLDFFQRLDIYDINGDTVSKKTFNAIKELQEQNKIMRDALEFISTLDNKELVGQEIKDLPKTISGITAREALTKVDNENN